MTVIATPSMFRGGTDWSRGNAMNSMMNWGGQSMAPMIDPTQIAAPVIDTSALQNLPAMSAGAAGNAAPGFMDGMLGYRGADGTQHAGWGGLALGGASALMNGYLGFQQLGVAKDQLAQSKKQFEINFGAQQKLTNSRLEDRQRARVASNPGAYQSVGEYMSKNGI